MLLAYVIFYVKVPFHEDYRFMIKFLLITSSMQKKIDKY